MLSGILLGSGTLPATILTSLFTDSLVKEGTHVHFLTSQLGKESQREIPVPFLGVLCYPSVLHVRDCVCVCVCVQTIKGLYVFLVGI